LINFDDPTNDINHYAMPPTQPSQLDGVHIHMYTCADQLPASQSGSEAELMQQWFDVVHEKNVLAGYESELVIQSVSLVAFAVDSDHAANSLRNRI